MFFSIIQSTVSQDGTRINQALPTLFKEKKEAIREAIKHGNATENHFLSADVVARSLGGSLFELSGCCMGNYTFVAYLSHNNEAH
tara:strand:+ start:73 stop:327 length:255 start_codon:yes stop_codon:yes gene_type:complete